MLKVSAFYLEKWKSFIPKIILIKPLSLAKVDPKDGTCCPNFQWRFCLQHFQKLPVVVDKYVAKWFNQYFNPTLASRVKSCNKKIILFIGMLWILQCYITIMFSILSSAQVGFEVFNLWVQIHLSPRSISWQEILKFFWLDTAPGTGPFNN